MMAMRGQEPRQRVEQLLHWHTPCCEVQALAWEVLAADDSEDEAHEAAQMILVAGTSNGSSQSL
jgi:hypothetical protein